MGSKLSAVAIGIVDTVWAIGVAVVAGHLG